MALLAVITAGIGAAAPARAQSQGPSTPSTVVEEPLPGGVGWFYPEQAAVSDDLYALAQVGPAIGQLTYYLKATGFGFAIPAGAVIEGIQVGVERKGIIVSDNAVRIVKGGVIGSTDRSVLSYWPFSDTVTTYGGSSDLWGETWSAGDINAGDFGFAISALNEPFGVAFVDAISITVFYNTLCGNSVTDVNEDCDDGNTANGDCCSSTCRFDVAGAPCPDATVCNGAETCDGAGGCDPGTALDCDDGSLCTQDSCHPVNGCVNAGSPVAACRSAAKSLLMMKDRNPDTKDRLLWKWSKGEPTDQATSACRPERPRPRCASTPAPPMRSPPTTR